MGLTQKWWHLTAVFTVLFEMGLTQEMLNPYSPNSEVEFVSPIDLPKSPYPHSTDSFFIRKAAVDNGMDPDAVSEVLRTKKPVVRIVNDGMGTTQTITYSLEDNGRISKKTRTQKRVLIGSDDNNESPRFRFNYDQNPFEHKWKFANHNNNYDPFNSDPFENPFETNHEPETTSTSTHIDERGRTVKTTIHTKGPRQWTTTNIEYPTRSWIERDTQTFPQNPSSYDNNNDVKIKKINNELSPTPPPLPSLEDFLKTQYGNQAPTTTISTPTTPKTLGTIDVSQIPITYNMPNGTKTITNILPTKDVKVSSSIPKANQPSVDNEFEPIENILKEAGLTDEDVKNNPEISIIKERTAPDGSVIKTVYKVKNNQPQPSYPNGYPLNDNSWINKNYPHYPNNVPKNILFYPNSNRNIPTISTTATSPTTTTTTTTVPPLLPLPKNEIPTPYFSASHSGTIFPTNETIPKTDDPKQTQMTSTTNKSVPEDLTDPDFWNIPELEENFKQNAIVTTTTTIPTTSSTTAKPKVSYTNYPQTVYSQRYPSKSYSWSNPSPPRPRISPIDSFLGKININVNDFTSKNGEIVLRFIDDDGRILTATLVLSKII